MATHVKTMKSIRNFLKFSEKFRAKKVLNKTTPKDEEKWAQLYQEVLKAIIDYDVEKIDYKQKTK